MRNYIAVVPARSGSKGVADKNIQSFRGQPLLVHSLRHGKEAKFAPCELHKVAVAHVIVF